MKEMYQTGPYEIASNLPSLISRNDNFIWSKLIQVIKICITQNFQKIEGFGVRIPIPGYIVHLLRNLDQVAHPF